MFAIIVILVIVCGALYLWYASIVTRKNAVLEALGGVDAQLQQRHDLIPNVLTIAKAFMAHETELFSRIARLREAASAHLGDKDFSRVGDKLTIEKQLGAEVGRLFARAEAYPELKSNATMIEAQRSYQDVETNIAAARRFYNTAVGDLRNAIQIFPGPMLARAAGVEATPPFFQADQEARAPVGAATFFPTAPPNS